MRILISLSILVLIVAILGCERRPADVPPANEPPMANTQMDLPSNSESINPGLKTTEGDVNDTRSGNTSINGATVTTTSTSTQTNSAPYINQ